ncbi:ABC transporter ATP-binding protein [Clostridiaceae bacterium 68-1-5]|uniref:ABC transporter ATP-binding protein n=1 Tax=Suipraeoptans intestinalis TaxID=2606628 RepID=A0A6N7UZF9_9FIRM|nr:ABC transporter ATP-binding protein [Suipraeoptans intestinalis]MDY3122430.1 ABC transporter ATP-binding protein [Suipraeoptans intestinalis]MSR93250.1 ABC transporter ATP-binding protein [Suipraeoptans intestinalis]
MSRRKTMGDEPVMEKAKDFSGAMKKLAAYFGEFKIQIVFVVLFAIGSTVFGIVGPKILGKATTELFQGLVKKIAGEGGIDFEKIAQILTGLFILYGVSAAMTFIQGILVTGIAQKMTYRLRREMSEKIHRLPMNYFDRQPHGEVLSRITNDVDTLSQSLNQSASQIISAVATILGVLIMMLSISPLMTVVSLSVLIFSMIIVSLVVGRSQKYFAQQQTHLGVINGQIEEIYGGQVIVKAFNQEKRVLEQFEKENATLYRSAWKSQFFSGMMMPIMQFVGNLGYVAVVILGGYLAIKKTIQVGDIQSFIQYVRQFTMPIQQVAQAATMIQSTAASAERIFEFLEEEEETETASLTVGSKTEPEREGEGAVTFEHVSFGYVEGQEIIHDFSVKIRPGQKVAIVGPTGAGKTTMVKLLMRFYDVTGGRILVDGKDIREMPRQELRQRFGMVLQDTWLFRGKIEENIRYGKLNASHEEVAEAAKAAHVHRFVKTLPGGYDMELNEEANNVSQGQKQLMTIARAILADPRILILDEATSSVDTRTEVQIQKAMANLMKGRTSFVIAHRLSTIRDADLILVMKDGDIVEQGDHTQLLEQNGFYAQLYQSQFHESIA